MDATLIRERVPLFINHLKQCDYSHAWQYRYIAECQKLIAHASDYDTIDEYLTMVQNTASNGMVAWLKAACIRKIHTFLYDGVLPERISKKTDSPLNQYYTSLLEYGIMIAKQQGKSAKTCQNYKDTMTTFFRHLEANNINQLDYVTENLIISYFNGTKKRGHTTAHLVIRFISLIKGMIGDELAERVDSYIPRVQKQHRVYKGLSSQERAQVETVILDGHETLTLKERAICALAFYTGIRACDIINLKFSDIDWKKNLISIVQVKTRKELILKLLPCYGNLVYDYITTERQQVNDPHIFLRTNGTKMTTHDTYRCTVKVLFAAGIRGEQIKRGIHLLRHSLATALIAKNTNFAVVTATLGHKSTRATFTYIDSEVEGLRKCGLSVAEFPVNEKFFEP